MHPSAPSQVSPRVLVSPSTARDGFNVENNVHSVELALAAWLPGVHAALGIFLPLIVTNCLVLARAEAFASRQPVGNALLDGFAMGGGFLVVLVVLGSAREMLGRGSLGLGLAWRQARQAAAT